MADRNNFFSIFQKKKDEKKVPFDENYFHINVSGGKLHSEKITIEAVSVQGGEKLRVQCNWFLISQNHDITKLELQDCSYQPSIEDVGCKFMVQVVPSLEGREYEGMPKSCDIGPLEKDQTIQEEIDELLENEKMTVLVQIAEVIKSPKKADFELPVNGLVRITLNFMELEVKKDDSVVFSIRADLEDQYPDLKAKRGTENGMVLAFDAENHFLVHTQDSSQRDIIITVVRGFYGKKVWKDQNGGEEPLQEETPEEHSSDPLPELQGEEQSEPADPNLVKSEMVPNSEPLQESAGNQPEGNEEEVQQLQLLSKQQSGTQSQSNEMEIQQEQPPENSQSQQVSQQDQQQQPQQSDTASLAVKSEAAQLDKTPNLAVENGGENLKQAHIRSEQKFHSVIVQDNKAELEKASPTKRDKKAVNNNNAELFMQINENVKLKKELAALQQQLEKEQSQGKKSLAQLQTVSDQLTNCTRNYYALESECNNQKKIIESLNDQRTFLQQDINMYKGQMIEYQEQLENYKSQLELLQKKQIRQAVTQDLNEAKKQIENLNHQLAEKDLVIEAANQDHKLSLAKIESLERSLEEYQNQLIHERKRYESLAIEKGIKPSPAGSASKEKEKKQAQLSDKRVAQSAIILDEGDKEQVAEFAQSAISLDQDFQGEVTRLKTHIQHLEATLRSLKIAYDQDIRLTNNKSKSSKPATSSKDNIKYLQHIANNMAEIITEKEMQLENQKNINKELISKVQCLQEEILRIQAQVK